MCGLSVRFSQTPVRRDVFNYALQVEVLSAVGISKKIFVYHQSPAGPTGNTFAEFDHVATPVDLQEIPENAASATVPWYRTDKCTVWVRSVSDLVQAKQLFVDDIRALQHTYGVMTGANNFCNQTTISFGDVPDDPDSGGSSDSDSSDSSDSSSDSTDEISDRLNQFI